MQRFIQALYDAGHIYSGEYEGYYCVGCEEYKQLDELLESDDGQYAGQLVCRIHSRPVEILKEKNYFFRMSDFEQRLLDLYRTRPDFVQPTSVRNEIVQFVKQGLDDLSISRSSFDWGVQVPWDHSHVRLRLVRRAAQLHHRDRLRRSTRRTSSAAGRRVQLVGKDIAALPRRDLAGHAHGRRPRGAARRSSATAGSWSAGRRCPSRSSPASRPSRSPTTFGSDAFRYYFLSAIAFGQDGSFSWEDLTARYNAELANGLGNLASRVIAMVTRYFGGAVPQAERDAKIAAVERRVADAANDAIDRFAIHEALAAAWELVDALNLYITETEPWALAKDDAKRARLEQVLATAVHGLGTLAVLLNPVIPKAAARLWEAIGGNGDLDDVDIAAPDDWTGSNRVSALDPPLFPRIEQDAAA